MKRYPKGKQRRKLAATLARLDRILAGHVPEGARPYVEAARNATAEALAKWGKGGQT